jgi:hypothetical protein
MGAMAAPRKNAAWKFSNDERARAGGMLAPVKLATHGGKLLQHAVHGEWDGIKKEGIEVGKGLALRKLKQLQKIKR